MELRSYGPTDGGTQPLIEMRRRIHKCIDIFTRFFSSLKARNATTESRSFQKWMFVRRVYAKPEMSLVPKSIALNLSAGKSGGWT